MVGWMDWWMYGWMDWWMERQTDRQRQHMNGWMDRSWINGWMIRKYVSISKLFQKVAVTCTGYWGDNTLPEITWFSILGFLGIIILEIPLEISGNYFILRLCVTAVLSLIIYSKLLHKGGTAVAHCQEITWYFTVMISKFSIEVNTD